MRIERRIRRLEARMTPERIILRFDDDSTTEIHGRRGFVLRLWPGLCEGDLNPEQAKQFELIRQSNATKEGVGGHMVDLLRALGPRLKPHDPPLAVLSRL